ncbi:MAG: APC family permease [Bacteriovoracaceae bacterium]
MGKKRIMQENSKKQLGLFDAVFLGIGAMIGAGIFALLGQAGAIAHSAVFISFILGGFIALLSGYSLSKLGVRFPSAGGIIEYLVQSYGVGFFSGGMSIALYIAALIALSLIAKAFGSYASVFFPELSYLKELLAVSIIIIFTLINLSGASKVTKIENIIVVSKVLILVVLASAGLFYLNTDMISPSTYPSTFNIASSIGVTFFAYEGFRVITNTAEDLKDVEKNLPLAMFIAIAIVMLLYIVLSISVFGNLPLNEVIQSKDYALAEVAKPIFGSLGFKIMVLTALISTSSAINANLFAVTNVTYQMAKNRELPSVFAKPIAHSKEGLIITSILTIILTMLFDLEQTAIIGSISILFIHACVHFGHLKIIKETKAIRSLVILALLGTVSAIGLISWYQLKKSPLVFFYLIIFIALSFLTEFIIKKITDKSIQPRTPVIKK